ncbi:hypothetical protein [Pyrobaculum sp.]|uniref:hypothetical protein n=1 Tax=Pyrobaculum sp. TaxID=2004705 RepID=UPI00319E4BC0
MEIRSALTLAPEKYAAAMNSPINKEKRRRLDPVPDHEAASLSHQSRPTLEFLATSAREKSCAKKAAAYKPHDKTSATVAARSNLLENLCIRKVETKYATYKARDSNNK